MIDVGKELEKYRSVFDVYCEREKNHPHYNEEETVKHTYVLHNYTPGISENKMKDIHRVGKILGDFYKNKYLWKDHFDKDSLGDMKKYLEKGKYKTI